MINTKQLLSLPKIFILIPISVRHLRGLCRLFPSISGTTIFDQLAQLRNLLSPSNVLLVGDSGFMIRPSRMSLSAIKRLYYGVHGMGSLNVLIQIRQDTTTQTGYAHWIYSLSIQQR